ncbi:MAG: hypothetical protein WBE48_09760 [Xanthobacteraceae bacterium]
MAWKSIDDARALGHTFSIAHALQRGGLTMMLIGDATDCRVIADELYLLAERNKFPWQLSDAGFFRGRLGALAGNSEIGIGQMRHEVKQPHNPGYRAVFLLCLAERELAIGEIDAAAATIEQASAEMQMHANNFCLPDAFRLRRSLDGEIARQRRYRGADVPRGADARNNAILPAACTAQRDEPGPTDGRNKPPRRRARSPCADLWSLHRRLRSAGSADGESATMILQKNETTTSEGARSSGVA